VYFHGGGFVFGDLDLSDWVCSSLAAGTGAVVISIDYRLAPESPHPAGVEDAYDATRWVASNADELGVRGDCLAVAGDSAGGTLAAVASLMAREAGEPTILQQTLLYPGTDLTLGSPSLAENSSGPILTLEDIKAYYDAYLAGADPRQPHASPLFAGDLSGLPPALIVTAEHDPLRDDGQRYAGALRDAGVQVRHTEYVGMPHGIVSFPGLCRAAPQVLEEVCAELRGALSSRA
jgi:acetyl esterase